jgi:hypothetical protein
MAGGINDARDRDGARWAGAMPAVVFWLLQRFDGNGDDGVQCLACRRGVMCNKGTECASPAEAE